MLTRDALVRLCRARDLLLRDVHDRPLSIRDVARDPRRRVQAGADAVGPLKIAVCADTCGNLVQLYQPPK